LNDLNEYYSKSGKFHGPSGSYGIIGMLDARESDSCKDLAEINKAEEAAQASFDGETTENDIAEVQGAVRQLHDQGCSELRRERC